MRKLLLGFFIRMQYLSILMTVFMITSILGIQTLKAQVVIDDRVEGTGLNQFEYVGEWETSTPASAYMETDHFFNIPDAYYQVKFEGTRIELYGNLSKYMGIIAVSIDGGEEVFVDLYFNGPEKLGVLMYSSPALEYGPHTIKVRITDQTTGGYNYTTIDKVIVYNETSINIDDRIEGTGLNQFEYVGEWETSTPAEAYMETDHFFNIPDAYYQVKFKGTRIELYGNLSKYMGIIAVSIDGGEEVLVDLYFNGPEKLGVLMYSSPALEYGPHTIKVRITDQTTGGYNYTTIDKVIVYKTPLYIDDRVEGTGLNQFEYVGEWETSTPAEAYMGTDHFFNIPDAFYQVRFEGTKIELYGNLSKYMGIIAVSIDGGEEVLIDLYFNGPEKLGVLMFSSPALEYGPHTVKVRITDQTTGGYNYTTIDKVIVYDNMITGIFDKNTMGDFRDIKIYPNPAQNFVTIDASECPELTDYTIKIFNLTGITVYEKHSSQQSCTINLDRIANKGMYFVQILDNFNKVKALKSIIMR